MTIIIAAVALAIIVLAVLFGGDLLGGGEDNRAEPETEATRNGS